MPILLKQIFYLMKSTKINIWQGEDGCIRQRHQNLIHGADGRNPRVAWSRQKVSVWVRRRLAPYGCKLLPAMPGAEFDPRDAASLRLRLSNAAIARWGGGASGAVQGPVGHHRTRAGGFRCQYRRSSWGNLRINF